MRIVSLIASATEILHALGLGRSQVGRSHECDYPPEVHSLPVCTRPRFSIEGSSRDIDQRVKRTLADASSVYEVFDDVLDQLRPTHVLTQSQCRVCAVSIDDVERALQTRFDWRPSVVALEPNSLADVWQDIRRVAVACGVDEKGESLVRELTSRMGDIARAAGGLTRPRFVCLEWQEPLMAAGNWAPELIAMAGAENLFGEAGRHSPWMQWDDLVRADPDAILVSPCGYDIAKTAAEMYWLEQRPEWQGLKAVGEGRVYLADGNQYFHRPGPRLADSLRILAEILHPDAFPPSHLGSGWVKFVGGS